MHYANVVFLVNGVLPADGRRITVSKDCKTVTFERALHSRLFTKITLKAILGGEDYKENDNRTVTNTEASVNYGISELCRCCLSRERCPSC